MTVDTQEKIGKLIDGTEKRDAVHVAVVPAVAAVALDPGEHVGPVRSGTDEFTNMAAPIGIVDPYLTKTVVPGERFYVFMYPMTVVNLRHDWSHPALEMLPDVDKAKSTLWMQDFVSSLEDYSPYDEPDAVPKTFTVEEVLGMAKNFLDTGDSYVFGDTNYPDIPDEFWDHYEALTGTRVQVPSRQSFFRCVC